MKFKDKGYEREGWEAGLEGRWFFRGSECQVKLHACSVTQLCLTLCNPMNCNPPASSVLWDFPGKNTGVSCQFLLQGVFVTQGSDWRLVHSQAHSLPQYHLGSPKLSWILFKQLKSQDDYRLIPFSERIITTLNM